MAISTRLLMSLWVKYQHSERATDSDLYLSLDLLATKSFKMFKVGDVIRPDLKVSLPMLSSPRTQIHQSLRHCQSLEMVEFLCRDQLIPMRALEKLYWKFRLYCRPTPLELDLHIAHRRFSMPTKAESTNFQEGRLSCRSTNQSLSTPASDTPYLQRCGRG